MSKHPRLCWPFLHKHPHLRSHPRVLTNPSRVLTSAFAFRSACPSRRDACSSPRSAFASTCAGLLDTPALFLFAGKSANSKTGLFPHPPRDGLSCRPRSFYPFLLPPLDIHLSLPPPPPVSPMPMMDILSEAFHSRTSFAPLSPPAHLRDWSLHRRPLPEFWCEQQEVQCVQLSVCVVRVW